jgi:NAD+ kinase
MPDFQTIGVITKQSGPQLADTLQALLDLLASRGLRVLLDESTTPLLGKQAGETFSREVLAREADLAIVVGGDGTLLNAGRTLADAGVPVLGINLGRLGFLVDVSPEEMGSRLAEILDGHYVEAPRFLLEAEVWRDETCIGQSLALNDVVVHVREVVRMIEFDTFIDGQFVNTQRADGMVVATPTGSTAYALSGGGPILHPGLDAIVLVPICPHTLSHRPIVVQGGSHIEIRICAHDKDPAQVSFDGQAGMDLEPRDRIVIRRKQGPLRLLHPKGYDYFHILRAKLRWGEQP